MNVLLAFMALVCPSQNNLVIEGSSYPIVQTVSTSNLNPNFRSALFVDGVYSAKSLVTRNTIEDLIELLHGNTLIEPNNASIAQELLISEPMALCIFTIPSQDFFTLSQDDIHGFLVVSRATDGNYTKFFARKINSGSQARFIIQMKQCRGTLEPAMTFDTIRGFHFASIMTVPYEIPNGSFINMLVNEDANFPSAYNRDLSNELDLYLDQENNIGRLASIFYQGNIFGDYSYFLNRGTVGLSQLESGDFEEYCGEAGEHCYHDPSSPFCHVWSGECDYVFPGGQGPCPARRLISTAQENALESSLPSFSNFYKFRDDFLSLTEKGRGYVRKWYTHGKHLKLWDTSDVIGSVARLNKYIRLTVEINSHLTTLFSDENNGSSETVFLSEDLQSDIIEVIDDHRGISSQLDADLDVLILDLNAISGKTRDEIHAYFEDIN